MPPVIATNNNTNTKIKQQQTIMAMSLSQTFIQSSCHRGTVAAPQTKQSETSILSVPSGDACSAQIPKSVTGRQEEDEDSGILMSTSIQHQSHIHESQAMSSMLLMLL